MTGKRSNQYDVDPGSPANSDNNDGAHDPNLKAADKARVAKTRTDERASMIPQRGKNPALAELQALFLVEAEKYHVLPLDDRFLAACRRWPRCG